MHVVDVHGHVSSRGTCMLSMCELGGEGKICDLPLVSTSFGLGELAG